MNNEFEDNNETFTAVNSSLNKIIKKVCIDDDYKSVEFEFKDNTKLKIFDDGQNCCEHRYMTTNDNLAEYFGAKLLSIELNKVPIIKRHNDDEISEIEFLDIKTSNGTFQIANHNEHNGYYGGFSIKASLNN